MMTEAQATEALGQWLSEQDWVDKSWTIWTDIAGYVLDKMNSILDEGVDVDTDVLIRRLDAVLHNNGIDDTTKVLPMLVAVIKQWAG